MHPIKRPLTARPPVSALPSSGQGVHRPGHRSNRRAGQVSEAVEGDRLSHRGQCWSDCVRQALQTEPRRVNIVWSLGPSRFAQVWGMFHSPNAPGPSRNTRCGRENRNPLSWERGTIIPDTDGRTGTRFLWQSATAFCSARCRIMRLPSTLPCDVQHNRPAATRTMVSPSLQQDTPLFEQIVPPIGPLDLAPDRMSEGHFGR